MKIYVHKNVQTILLDQYKVINVMINVCIIKTNHIKNV